MKTPTIALRSCDQPGTVWMPLRKPKGMTPRQWRKAWRTQCHEWRFGRAISRVNPGLWLMPADGVEEPCVSIPGDDIRVFVSVYGRPGPLRR